jgi:2-octaprenyl-6-methoxyphenol hydroxylase
MAATRRKASQKNSSQSFDVCVAGSGLAGLTAALALGRQGCSVAAIAPAATRPDLRTTALFAASIDYLKRLDVWDKMAQGAAKLASIRLIDATDRLVRAPQVDFHANEIGLEAFGYNVANRVLGSVLRDAAMATGNVTFIEDSVEDASFTHEGATLNLAGGSTIDCRLAVAADGRNSVLRRVSNIGEHRWQYPQSALVLDFEHEIPHHDVSTEFHTPAGPFAAVPLGEKRSSLVWVEQPGRAEALSALPFEELEIAIEERMQSMLGKIHIVSKVQTWPLSGMTARRYGMGPLVLVGEAAHVFPPIGAQGFNLGIRDVELVDRLAAASGRDGLAGLGERYHARRLLDIGARTAGVDVLNRSLLSAFLPVQIARSLALQAFAGIGPLRRMVMREGVAPGSQLRHLMDRLLPAR